MTESISSAINIVMQIIKTIVKGRSALGGQNICLKSSAKST
jgi:hypothetical protein